jgi:hypothetical protein
MQDHFEKIAMNKAIEVGGKKAFELLEESIQRFSESLRYTESGSKEIRSEIAGYRKGLLELYRDQVLGGIQPEAEIAAALPDAHHEPQTAEHISGLNETKRAFKKEILEVMEQLADSYIEAEEATALILSIAETFADKVQNISCT